LVFWYWFFVGPALLLAIFSLRGERQRAAYVARRLSETPSGLPPATVIVPVKGADDGLRENLAALAAQDYPDYELIVTARSAADIPPGVLPHNVHVVLAHGGDPSTGEKVQNLIPTGASLPAGCAPWRRPWRSRGWAHPPVIVGTPRRGPPSGP
jgi:cellulose synthase/poly-beta-1,6-N-acetylglucosamine synthase-like glycosyltransferase